MIASVRFVDDGKDVTVVLGDDGTWRGSKFWNPSLNAMLKVADRGPQTGKPFYHHAQSMADLLGGEMVYEEKASPEPGTIF